MKRVCTITLFLCLLLTSCGKSGPKKVYDEYGIQKAVDEYQTILTNEEQARTVYFRTTDTSYSDKLPDGSEPSFYSYLEYNITYAPASGWVSYTVSQDVPSNYLNVANITQIPVPDLPTIEWDKFTVDTSADNLWDCWSTDGSHIIVSVENNRLIFNSSMGGVNRVWEIHAIYGSEPERPTPGTISTT